jgi:hypothetical protein
MGTAGVTRGTIMAAMTAALAAASPSGPASAIDLLPFDYVPAPPGSTALLGYYLYGTRDSFETTDGRRLERDTGLDTHIAAARLTHWNEIAGTPVAAQLILPYGVARNGEIGGLRLDETDGFFDPTLTLAFWPISNHETGTHLAVANYLTFPFGDHDDGRNFSFGENRFRNDLQIGFSQRLSHGFTLELAADWLVYGDNDDPFGGDRLTQDQSVEAYAWLAWSPDPASYVAAGYAGAWGGERRLDGVELGQRVDFQQLRVAAGRFVTPTTQLVGSLGRDIDARGAFRQDLVVQLRVLTLF